ncbi:HTH-type transcriptional regulator BenM [compost metagenome]
MIGRPIDLVRLAFEPFVLYPVTPRPSYADHIMALFTNQGLSVQVIQWTNELQTALGLVAAGLGITLVPASVQRQHRDDIVYAPLSESAAVSPIILSRRAGDNSPQVRHCLGLIEAMIGHS